MVENSEKSVDFMIFNSLDDIKNTLLDYPGEKEFVEIESEHVNYRMSLSAFRYGDDLKTPFSARELRDIAEGWYLVDPIWISLLQGLPDRKIKAQIDAILNKVRRTVDLEDRKNGIYTLIKPEGNKFGILFEFHLDEEDI